MCLCVCVRAFVRACVFFICSGKVIKTFQVASGSFKITERTDRHTELSARPKFFWIIQLSSWPRGYKTFFMLNSTEHEISTAHKN